MSIEDNTLVTLTRSLWVNDGTFRIEGDGRLNGSTDARFRNEGLLGKYSGSGTSNISPSFRNDGQVEAFAGRLNFSGTIEQFDQDTNSFTGGRWKVENGAEIRFAGITEVQRLGSEIVIDPEQLLNQAGPNHSTEFVIDGPGSAFLNSNNDPLFDRDGLTIESGAALRVSDGASVELTGPLVLDGGTLSGDGTVTASPVTVAASGNLSPGNSPGLLTIGGDLVLGPGSRYLCEFGPEGFDQVTATGNIQLGGSFVPVFIAGFIPTPGTSYTIASGASISGSFDGQDLGYAGAGLRFRLETTATQVVATVEVASYANYAAWVAEYFSPAEAADDSISGPLADPDGDGMVNQLEYAMGRRPKFHDPVTIGLSNLTPGSDGTTSTLDLSFPWAAEANDVTFGVGISDDLADWQPATFQIIDDILDGGLRLITVRAEGLTSIEDQQFFRIEVKPMGE